MVLYGLFTLRKPLSPLIVLKATCIKKTLPELTSSLCPLGYVYIDFCGTFQSAPSVKCATDPGFNMLSFNAVYIELCSVFFFTHD